jgi:O-antigen ligase
MSYIPGVKWERVVMDRTKTNFRSTLNEIALEKIALHPFVGNGLSVSEAEIMELEMMEQYAVGETDSYAYKMAAGSAWHNTWLGISADFGIPAAIIYALFWIQFIKYAVQIRRRLPKGSHARVLVNIILIGTIGGLLQSWVSGHSIEDVMWSKSWAFGLLLALKYQLDSGNSDWHRLPAEEASV